METHQGHNLYHFYPDKSLMKSALTDCTPQKNQQLQQQASSLVVEDAHYISVPGFKWWVRLWAPTSCQC